MSHTDRLEKQYHLLKASLWYIKWSNAFLIVSILSELVSLWELLRDNMTSFAEVITVALAVSLFALYLRGKSDRLREEARDFE